MSKHYHHHQPQPFLSAKKLRQWLIRLVLVALVAAGVVLAKPDLVQDVAQRRQVEKIREQVLEANIQGQEKALQILGDTTQKTSEVVGQVSQATREVTQQDPQEIVNATVANITNQVKDLPQEEVKKIKLQFCQDVLKVDNQQ